MGKFIWKEKDKTTGEKKVVYRKCEYCGQRFLVQMPHQRFDKLKCRVASFRRSKAERAAL
jgi:hypothetical protein